MTKKSLVRRLLQLRLATLMILVTMCCLGMAFRQAYIVPFGRQAAAAKRLREMRAAVRFETPWPAWLAVIVGRDKYRDVVAVKLEHCNIGDEQLAVLRVLPRLRYLYLAGNEITDAGLEHLTQLRNVERLSLWRTEITDAGLKKLANMRRLRALDIHATRISDDGLAALANHPDLRVLKLGPRITNDGLNEVGKLHNLSLLDLSETWVSPEGLPHLDGTSLEDIVLSYRNPRLHGAELVNFRNLVHLRKLPRPVVQCTDEDVAHLSRLERLEALDLSGRKITDLSAAVVARLPALKSVRMGGNITPAGILKLGSTKIESVDVFTAGIETNNVDLLVLKYSGSPTMRVYTPWLTTAESTDVNLKFHNDREPKANFAIYSLVEVSERMNDVFSLTTGLGTEIIDDWRPLLRWPKLGELKLHLAGESRLPTDIIEGLSHLRRLECSVHELSVDDARRLAKLPIEGFVRIGNLTPDIVHEFKPTSRNSSLQLRLTLNRENFHYYDYAFEKDSASGPRVLTDDSPDWPSRVLLLAPATSLFNKILSQEKITDIALSHVTPELDLSGLVNASQVRSLSVSDSQMQPKQWRQIWDAPSLVTLVIHDCFLRDQDLEGVEQLHDLEFLALDAVLITDRSLDRIAKLQNLKVLHLEPYGQSYFGPYLTDSGAAELGRLKMLEQLRITSQPIEGRAFSAWKDLHNLRMLFLTHCDVNDRWIADLAVLPNLEFLDLVGTRVTDASIDPLKLLLKLKNVQTWGTAISGEGQRKLQRALQRSGK